MSDITTAEAYQEAAQTAANPESEATEAPTSGTASADTYTVKVNGEELEVTLEELQAGFMRQADYTRKTTDLANQRQELEPYIAVAEAFDQDAETALRAMGRHYGIEIDSAQTAVPASTDAYGYEVEDEAPIAARDPRIDALAGEVEVLRTNQAQSILKEHAEALVKRHPDADPEEVIRHARARGFPNLESAYRDLAFEERDAIYQAQRSKAAAEEEIVSAKRSAGVVTPGTGVAAGSVSEAKAGGPMSFKDALRETMDEMNIKGDDLPGLWG